MIVDIDQTTGSRYCVLVDTEWMTRYRHCVLVDTDQITGWIFDALDKLNCYLHGYIELCSGRIGFIIVVLFIAQIIKCISIDCNH